MEWELLGYREYPFSVNPISISTLDLFTGHEKELKICQNVLHDNNVRIIIEGERGVGTTSFANFLKFSALTKKDFLSPRDEVSVEKNWNLESLLTAIVSTIVRELEISHEQEVKKTSIFIDAKSLSYRLSEAYNNFGVNAFSFGASYGKSGSISQPTFVPSTTLGHHLEDLGKLAVQLGYKRGILIQLNNLDINTIHTEDHLDYLFNALRDYLQIHNISWLLVGDVGLKSFISRRVDRLDDIISDSIQINPLTRSVYHELIFKRLRYFRLRKTNEFPISQEVFDYLYDVAHGRLRYIFGIIYNMLNRLQTGKLVQNISTELAKSTIALLAKERMQKFSLSKSEILLIKTLVKEKELNVMNLAMATHKNRTLISRMMNQLLSNKIVTVKQEGKQRIYIPSLDAKIAFSPD